jgi:hypothetical protein
MDFHWFHSREQAPLFIDEKYKIVGAIFKEHGVRNHT